MQHYNFDFVQECQVLENTLQQDGFQPEPGSTARLGELLLACGVVDQETINHSLDLSRTETVPLGNILIRYHGLDSAILVRALKLQSLVRKGKMTLESAEEKLTRHHQRRGHSREFQI